MGGWVGECLTRVLAGWVGGWAGGRAGARAGAAAAAAAYMCLGGWVVVGAFSSCLGTVQLHRVSLTTPVALQTSGRVGLRAGGWVGVGECW
jgi:hypothetical protein